MDNTLNGIRTIGSRPAYISERSWNYGVWRDAVDFITEGRVAWCDIIQAEGYKLLAANYNTSALRDALAKLAPIRDEVVALHRAQDRAGWTRKLCEREDRDIAFLLDYPLA